MNCSATNNTLNDTMLIANSANFSVYRYCIQKYPINETDMIRYATYVITKGASVGSMSFVSEKEKKDQTASEVTNRDRRAGDKAVILQNKKKWPNRA
jgi:hypothetical protein